MANLYNDEKILHTKVISSTDANSQNDNGIVIINPNKIINEYNEIQDRYVKQEDLVIYASLKVYKKSDSTVVYNTNDNTSNYVNNNEVIYINFLNPISENNRTPKGKLTSEWADFFTNEESQDMIDPETFGITKIDIKINANHFPTVVINFVDIRGKMLFERGNDEKNPYNLFFTFPYPKFLLKYKGYYGKAIETQLVLLKSNINFDSEEGNYNITAEFTADVFSFFSTFLIIYAYAAPYMYELTNGEYLGMKILESLYNRQNQEIKNIVGENRYSKYEINGNPTMLDLASALKKISSSSLESENQLTNSDEILNNKSKITSYSKEIIDFISNNTNYTQVSQQDSIVIYRSNGSNKIDEINKTPEKIYSSLNTINQSLLEINNFELPNGENDFFTKLKNDINSNEKLKEYGTIFYADDANDEYLKGDILIYKKNNNDIFLDGFRIVIEKILDNIYKLESKLESFYIEQQVQSLKNTLNYEPNLGNVLRIISNNCQTFLILLDIASKNALIQLKNNDYRKQTQELKTDYIKDKNEHRFSIFPNYYRKINEFIDGESVEKNVQSYPGVDFINKEWHEVKFVDEIYNAIQRIKQGKKNEDKKEVIPINKTGILTLYQLGEENLNTYISKSSDNVIGEILTKYSLYSSYSGILFKGLDDNSVINYLSAISDFEMSLIGTNVINKISDENAKFVFKNDFKNATKETNEGETVYTNLGNFGIKFLGFPKNVRQQDAALTTLENLFEQYSNLINKSYSEEEFSDFINDFKIKTTPDKSNLYRILNFENFASDINYYSIDNKKRAPISHIIDLTPNLQYYCEISELLNPIFENKNNVSLSKINSNPFQGFYLFMNVELNRFKINTDLSRIVRFQGEDIAPALTFNTKKINYEDVGENTPFSIVASDASLEEKLFKIYNII